MSIHFNINGLRAEICAKLTVLIYVDKQLSSPKVWYIQVFMIVRRWKKVKKKVVHALLLYSAFKECIYCVRL